MNVVEFFDNFFKGFGGLIDFINTPFKVYLPAGFDNMQLTIKTIEVTPLTAFGVSIGTLLIIVFGLHLWHLIKLVF